MYRIGLILGPAMFIGAVLEWILRITHYVDLIEKTLPWTEHMISPNGIWVTMVVGILIFVAAWAERRREKDEEGKHRKQKLEDTALRPQAATSAVGNIRQKVSPVNTVDASQKVEIHNYPPVAPQTPAHRAPPPQGAPMPRNVQFMGLKRIKTDVSQEIFDATEGFVGVKACFLNKVIPGAKTSDFDYVKARVVLRDASGTEVAEITKPKWLDHEPGDAVHICVNQTACILLAVFGGDDEWAAPFISTNPSNYWDDGTRRLMVEGCSLPEGELSAEITLVGEDNVGLNSVTAHFTLNAKGSVEIKQ